MKRWFLVAIFILIFPVFALATGNVRPSGLVALTDPTTDDVVVIDDSSANTTNKITLADVLEVIIDLPDGSANVDNSDEMVMINDPSGTPAAQKIEIGDIGGESETHASEHAVSGADTVYPTDPNADKWLKWDDDPGELVWDTPAAGGDVTAVGDCVSGDCLDGADANSGTYIRLWDGDSHYVEFNPGDITANRTLATRDAAGTLLISGDTLTGDVTATFDTDGSTAATVTDLTITSEATGSVVYFDGSNWIHLAVGSDGEYLKSNATSTVEWATPAAGGDVTAVGDCLTGDCLDGADANSGTYIRLWDGDSHYVELNPGDITANRTLATRDAGGTLLISGDTLTGDVTATFDTDGSTAATVTDLTITSEATGSVVYFDGSNWVHLAIGTAGQVLEVSAGGIPEWDTDDSGAAPSKLEAGDSFVEVTDAGTGEVVIDVDDEDLEIKDGGTNEIAFSSNTGVTRIDSGALVITSYAKIYDDPGAGANLTSDHAQNNIVVTNDGAGAARTYNLPAAVEGMTAYFHAEEAQTITIDVDGSDIINMMDGTALDPGDTIDSDGTQGASVFLIAHDATNWWIHNMVGSWSDGGAS
jgi:hypothetical protein